MITTRANSVREPAGIGYVFIPKDKDAKEFIEYCRRNNAITILLEDGGYIDNVLVGKSLWNEIEFPETEGTLGSIIFWVNQPKNNQPVAVALISKNNEIVSLTSKKASLRRSSVKGLAEVLVDGNNGNVFINAAGLSDTGGNIFIVSKNKKKNSTLNLAISGSIQLTSQSVSHLISDFFEINIANAAKDKKVALLRYKKGEGLSYEDEFENTIKTTEDKVQISPKKKFDIGDGKEPMVLGKTLEDLLKEATDLISDIATASASITVIASSLGSPTSVPANVTDFTQIAIKAKALKEKYSTFKSKISNTD